MKEESALFWIDLVRFCEEHHVGRPTSGNEPRCSNLPELENAAI